MRKLMLLAVLAIQLLGVAGTSTAWDPIPECDPWNCTEK